MSKVTRSPVWYPPQFPEQGRLPSQASQVEHNLHRQGEMERAYHGELSVAAGRLVMPPCCKTLHVSLFFDGTGNNLFNDLYRSAVPHPTNIARLYLAAIGNGYTGGAAGVDGLTDAPGTGYNNYFKYYIPGVGTPFPEIGNLDYSTMGLMFGTYGEERINWGLMMMLNALRQIVRLPALTGADLLKAVKAMGEVTGIRPARSRRREFDKQILATAGQLRWALAHAFAGQPKLVGLRLYVYGFSRGAAAARAFVSWLNELLDHSEPGAPAIVVEKYRLPVEVTYLGLLDTVASVGMADPVPGSNGHMSWADNSQQLPLGNSLVKRCLHLVSSHEQRLCFPLESIRHGTGIYAENFQEVIYPGVHSDVGGGYAPGDQGKASSQNSRLRDSNLLSHIALNDLYADAFSHGAPFKVPTDTLRGSALNEHWRMMDAGLALDFIAAPELIRRFNSWRNITLGLPLTDQPLSEKEAAHYQPIPATDTLEQALRAQLGWLTAWRIDRYAFASLEQTAFYRQASNTHNDPLLLAQARIARDAAQKKIVSGRIFQSAIEERGRTKPLPLEPGLPGIDPDLAQTQLRDAAKEFGEHFRNADHLRYAINRLSPAYMPPMHVFDVIHVDAGVECLNMKAAGRARVKQLFPPPAGFYNHLSDDQRGQVDEHLNAHTAEGQLRALFDDQVHDSRAWFLYSWKREPMGSYFRERMVFFGEVNRRELAINGEQDRALLAGHLMPMHFPNPWDELIAQREAELAKKDRALLTEAGDETT